MTTLTQKYFLTGFFFFTLITFAEGVVIQVDSDFDGKLDIIKRR